MAIKKQDDMRKGARRLRGRRTDDVKEIIMGGEGDKGRDVTVRYKTAPQRKEKSTFSWFEEFTMEWSETLIFMK